MENQANSIGRTGPSFLDHSHTPSIHLQYDLLKEIWFLNNGLNQVITTAAHCSFCSGGRSHEKTCAKTCFMPRSCVRILDTVGLGIPRSASSSHTVCHQSLWIAARTRSTFSGVLLGAGLSGCGSLSTDSRPPLKCLCHIFICAALIASSPKAF